MKILINGYYGFGNLGDDLLVMFFTRVIKKFYPNDEIFIFSNATSNNHDFKMNENYNDYLIDLVQIKKSNIIDWTYKGHFDIVFNGGGGTFFDYTKASTIKKIINKFVILLNPKTVFNTEQTIRKILGKNSNITFDKAYAIGNNVGPFSIESNRFIQLYSKIGSIDKFLVRDFDSKVFLEKFNYQGSFAQISDVVYCKSYFPEIIENENTNNIKTIGITIMNWNNEGEKYLKRFNELSKILKEQNIHTKLFAFSELDDEKLQKYTDISICIWKPNEIKIEDYLKELSSVDCMLAMRFHALVIANIQNIPCIGIGINNKIIDYVNQTNKVNSLVGIDFLVNDILNEIDNMNSNLVSITKKLSIYKNNFLKTEKVVENFVMGLSK